MTDVTFVLLPGMDGTGVMFRPLLEHLPARARAVVVAYPPARVMGYAELLELVEARLPVGPFVLVGESFSGPLAIVAAARRPTGLRGVVLCATFVRNPLRGCPKWLAPLLRPTMFRLIPQLILRRGLLGRYCTPALAALLREALKSVTPAVLAARARAVVRVDVAAELGDCGVPILYLCGTCDRVVRRRNLADIQKVCPTVRVARLDAPHLVLQTQPAAAVREMMEFAKACSIA